MTAPKTYILVVCSPTNGEWFGKGEDKYKYCLLFHKGVSIQTFVLNGDGKITLSSSGNMMTYEVLSNWRVVYEETIIVDN